MPREYKETVVYEHSEYGTVLVTLTWWWTAEGKVDWVVEAVEFDFWTPPDTQAVLLEDIVAENWGREIERRQAHQRRRVKPSAST